MTSPLNLPALGRYQPLYLSFRFGRDLCLCYTVAWAGFVPPPLQRAPFFQSYGVKLPSSLTRVLSNTLGLLSLSTRVGLRYGRSYFNGNEAFLGDMGPAKLSRVSPQLPPTFS